MGEPTQEQMRRFYKEIEAGNATEDNFGLYLNSLSNQDQPAQQVEVVDKLSEIQKWCKPISDKDAVRILSGVSQKDREAPKSSKVSEQALQEVKNLRRFAKEVFGWSNELLFFKIKAGFDFQVHAPQIGPCYNNWKTTSKLQLRNREVTQASIVFFIPRLIPNSTSKKAPQQIDLMKELKEQYNLPNWCLNGFGSASLNTLLILDHYHRTGQRIPPNFNWIRTDTLHADGYRLGLGGFDESGLDCDGWSWDDDSGSVLGCFLSGVWTSGSLVP